jgi:two-component system OmpR family response regulator
MPKTILIADDDAHIREVIRFALEKAGMTVSQAGDGKETLAKFDAQSVDLVVLDINMPELDGLDVCRAIRKFSDVPILFLSSRDDEIDRIIGLEIGGDDYVTKPFSPRELVARVNVILKRRLSPPQNLNPALPIDSIQHGYLAIFPTQHRVSWKDQAIQLTATEFAILTLFSQQPTHVFNRDAIMNKAYAHTIYVSDRTIDSHIRHIRQKFADAGCPAIIDTVHGVGYKLGLCQ